jgi:uncharacterized cupin superfamily protein
MQDLKGTGFEGTKEDWLADCAWVRDPGEARSMKVGEELENVIEGKIEIGRGYGQTTG